MGLDVADGWGFAAGLNSTEGLEFAAGVEHAPGEAGYPLLVIIKSPEFEFHAIGHLFCYFCQFYPRCTDLA